MKKLLVLICSVFCLNLAIQAQNSKLKAIKITDFECQTAYISGQSNTLLFSLKCNSDEYEYVDSVSLTFPEGFTVLSASDSIGGEYFGYKKDNFVCWGDNDNYFGGISTEDTVYRFYVVVDIPESSFGDKKIKFFLSGDNMAVYLHTILRAKSL